MYKTMKTIRLILAIIAVATFTVAEAQNIEKSYRK